MADYHHLFADHTGQLVAANLFTACREAVVETSLLRDFGSALRCFPDEVTGPARAHAENVVFGQAAAYQLKGPPVRPPRRKLINIRELTKLHKVLASRYRPNHAPAYSNRDVMFREVSDWISRHPDDLFGHPERLMWIAEPTEQAEQLFGVIMDNPTIPERQEAVDSLGLLLQLFGLPVYGGSPYLVSHISWEDWGSGANEASYRRPTVFDGVDGDYFKQLHLAPCETEHPWNTTADLRRAPDGEISDGTWEAVGYPILMRRVQRFTVVNAPSHMHPVDPRQYVLCVRSKYEAFHKLWADIPHRLAEMERAP